MEYSNKQCEEINCTTLQLQTIELQEEVWLVTSVKESSSFAYPVWSQAEHFLRNGFVTQLHLAASKNAVKLWYISDIFSGRMISKNENK